MALLNLGREFSLFAWSHSIHKILTGTLPSLFHRREVHISPLNPRPRASTNRPPTQSIWCGFGTTIYLVLTFHSKMPEGSTTSPLILSMLRDAIILIDNHLQQHGDGPIEDGTFHFSDYGVSWLSINRNNHQQTWGVLAAAVEALTQYMMTHSTYGSVSFGIYDGRNQVGEGTLNAAS